MNHFTGKMKNEKRQLFENQQVGEGRICEIGNDVIVLRII